MCEKRSVCRGKFLFVPNLVFFVEKMQFFLLCDEDFGVKTARNGAKKCSWEKK